MTFRDLLFDRRKASRMQPGARFSVTLGDAPPFIVEAYTPHSAVNRAMHEYGLDFSRMMNDAITIRVERLSTKPI